MQGSLAAARRPRPFTVLSVLSLLLCAICVAMWLRGLRGEDFWTFTVGGNFFQCTADDGGVRVRWLADVPADSRPAGSAMGRQRLAGEELRRSQAARRPPRGAFLNVPDATLRTRRFAGVEWTWGTGQILQPTFFLYRASPLLPLRGVAIAWRWLLAYAAIIPTTWLALRTRRRWTMRQRLRRGLCPACGYDLRATPGRCPECGAVATPA